MKLSAHGLAGLCIAMTMDTIIYIYTVRAPSEFHKAGICREEYDMGDYKLVRFGISPDFLRILQGKKDGSFLRRILSGDSDRSCFVCQEPIPFLEGWSFTGYLQEEWLAHMMGYACPPHFIVLGRVNCLPWLLDPFLKRLKSLRWILPERQYGEEELKYVEEICREYGLAVELQLLDSAADYRRLRMQSFFSVTVLDFSGEEKLSCTDLAEGSRWLDMESSETKRERLQRQRAKVAYFSLKKEWKEPQKALYQLDTIHKNGYNT